MTRTEALPYIAGVFLAYVALSLLFTWLGWLLDPERKAGDRFWHLFKLPPRSTSPDESSTHPALVQFEKKTP